MPRPHRPPSQQAFTMVELAVVLAIIGLIAGGIIGGKSLIRTAELTEIVSTFNKYKMANNRFVQQYKFLPGDFADATEYWGEAAAGTACGATIGTGTATCNGNANASVTNATSTSSEHMRFWQHLANAGLIEGKYTGVPSTGDPTTFGSSADNSPTTRRDGGLWFVWNRMGVTSNTTIFEGDYGNYLAVGMYNPGASWPSESLLRGDEAYSIDVKLDDGKAGTGSVIGYSWGRCTTASSSADTAAAEYKIAGARRICALWFPYSLKI